MERIAKYFYSAYLKYITRFRALPLEIDMLRPVERRVLLSVYEIAKNKFVKSAKVVGHCIGSYHPHSDASTYGTLVRYVKQGLVDGQGGFYSYGLEDNPPSAMRYTEVKANPKIAKLMELVKYADWENIEFEEEPLYLPSPIPLGLIGKDINYGIAVHKTTYPSYTMSDLFQRLLYLLDRSDKDVKIKPNLEGCSIVKGSIDDLLKTGKSTIRFRANYEIKNKELHIYGMPVNFNKLKKYAEQKKKSLTDLSTNKVHIVLNDTSKDAIKSIEQDVQFTIYTVNLEGMVNLLGIDNLLLNSFNAYKTALGRKLNSEIADLKSKISEAIIIQKIKPYVKDSNTIEDLSKKSKVPLEDLRPIVQKYSIQKLITIKTDIDSLKEKLKETESNLKKIDDYSKDQVEKLKNELNL